MPRDKDLKRLIRARMQKTGESYTAARRQLLAKKIPTAAEASAITGVRDETVRARTGRPWAAWVRALDRVNGTTLSHADMARYLRDTYPEVTNWWAQSLTVGYERIRGLRDAGQRRGGGYDANKSRTYPVPVATLYRAWAEARRRRAWLAETPTIRTSQKERSIRMTWPDGTNVDVHFLDKGGSKGGGSKSTVAIQHRGLRSGEDRERAKAAWAGRLNALGSYLVPRE